MIAIKQLIYKGELSMSQKQDITNLTTLLFSFMNQPDPMLSMLEWLCNQMGEEVKLCCAIGDREVDGKSYDEIVRLAKEYIDSVGGFEKFAEWGLF